VAGILELQLSAAERGAFDKAAAELKSAHILLTTGAA
jgi:hypothetical protein